MQKKKIVHIHSDPKFLHSSKIFEGEYFENIIVFYDEKSAVKPQLPAGALFLKKDEMNKLIKHCEEADLVVLFNLTLPKCKLVLKLPVHIKIAWRFFGHELYGRKKSLFLSPLSLKYIENKHTLKTIPKMAFHRYRSKRYGRNLKKAITRIDFMLVLSREEYDFLANLWVKLPNFVNLPHRWVDIQSLPDLREKIRSQKRIVVVGNNRNPMNNHLDVISTINLNDRYDKNYKFKLLFNYGPEGSYAEAVRKAVKNNNNYELIDEFLPKEEFGLFYEQISALVINGYRQMAGANIFMALQYGVKVYLNQKNAHYQWLKNEGFYIYNMEAFEKDLKQDSLFLTKEVAEKNFHCFREFSLRYNEQHFQDELYRSLIKTDKNNHCSNIDDI